MTRLFKTHNRSNTLRMGILFTVITGTILSLTFSKETDTVDKQDYKKLTPDEERVILHKGTEAPFTGTYNDFDKKGAYHCKQCDALLYQSEDKFKSSCGWPSFDDEVDGAVRREPDADGRRTEILCNTCGGHLGHVFEGEGLTEKNIRHCVNSISMTFKPADQPTAKAYFAGGCFWGVEYLFQSKDGVTSAVSGYMGGSLDNPTYREICTGTTGHLEVVEVTYNPGVISYEALTKFFFEIHDPTQKNGQGPDIGEQYLSAVFYQSETEKNTAEQLIQTLRELGYDVATQLRPAAIFWEAEDYHQDYYEKKRQEPYCHIYKKRFK